MEEPAVHETRVGWEDMRIGEGSHLLGGWADRLQDEYIIYWMTVCRVYTVYP